MPEKLEVYNPQLQGVCYLPGVGLCSNVYVLDEGDALTLVDSGSGDKANRLGPQLEELGFRLGMVRRVVLTHTHPDHTGGLKEILDAASPEILCHQADSWALGELKTDLVRFVREGEILRIGPRDYTVLHTPGHTAGSVCLYGGGTVFTGDTVFPGGSFGRVDLPTGNPRALVESLRRLTTLDVDVMLPGHEEPVLKDARSQIQLSYRVAASYL